MPPMLTVPDFWHAVAAMPRLYRSILYLTNTLSSSTRMCIPLIPRPCHPSPTPLCLPGPATLHLCHAAPNCCKPHPCFAQRARLLMPLLAQST